MRELVFDISEQTLKKNKNCSFENIVRGTDKYLVIKLNCSHEWKKVNKVISIKSTDNVEYYIPYYDSPVYLTKEMTQGSLFALKVTGKGENVTMQTNIILVNQV